MRQVADYRELIYGHVRDVRKVLTECMVGMI